MSKLLARLRDRAHRDHDREDDSSVRSDGSSQRSRSPSPERPSQVDVPLVTVTSPDPSFVSVEPDALSGPGASAPFVDPDAPHLLPGLPYGVTPLATRSEADLPDTQESELAVPTLISASQSTPSLPLAPPTAPLVEPEPRPAPQPALEGDETLSEAQLRKLFEDEEIERFLNLFSSNVKGVTLASSVGDGEAPAGASPSSAAATIELPPNLSPINAFLLRKLIPLLPTEPVPFSQDPSEPFSLSKLQANATRLYVFFPAYSKLFASILRIATWEDSKESAKVCAVFWFLWYLNLLLPTLFLRLLYEIASRRYLPYPSLAELRERRLSTKEADKFGQAAGMNYSSALGITEVLGFKMAWRSWRLSKRKRKVVQKVDAQEARGEGDDSDSDDDDDDKQEEEDQDDANDQDDGEDTASEGETTDRRTHSETTEKATLVSPSASVDSLGSFDSTFSESARSTMSTISSLFSVELDPEQERRRAERRAEKERRKAERRAAQEEERRRKVEEKERRKAEKVEERRRKLEEKEKKRDEDWRKGLMIALGEIADMHERVKNMFLWREPRASRVYTFVFAGLSAFTLFVPARYIAKTVYALIGVAYFFLIPLLRAMPAKDLARIPPAFSDVPTDATYAFGLIKQRAQQGESLVPSPAAKQEANAAVEAGSSDPLDLDGNVKGMGTEDAVEGEGEKRRDWTKWIEKGRRPFAWAEETRRVLKGAPTIASMMVDDNVSSYPAQFAASPGTLHISPTELWFTAVTLTEVPSTRIALSDIGGVKKIGMLGFGGGRWGGLEIKLKTGEAFKYPYVGNRNEAFAQLLAHTEQSWLRM